MDTQSIHAVEYNNDLLIEILVRLPVISLVLFKSVSKRWLSLISNPTFYLRRSQNCDLDPPSSLLLQQYWPPHGYDFVSFDTRISCKSSILKNPFSFGSKLHDLNILQSCNGLLLCCKANEYYVYNPCINLLKMVPQCLMKIDYGTRIAFDPTKSPHYKVIQVVLLNDSDDSDDDDDDGDGDMFPYQIQTYSSETDMRCVCTSQYPRFSFNYFKEGIFWNDALYWLNRNNTPLLFKLDTNVEHQALTTIETPITLDGKVLWFCKLFETCGCLLLLCRKYGCPRLMDVYEMRKGYSEWLLKYCVNLNDNVSCLRRSCTPPCVLSIVLGEREEDSFIVIQDSTKIFQYKPVLKTYHDLYDLESADSYRIFQFIASFAGVGL